MVSAFSYSTAPQGDTVCDVHVTTAEGRDVNLKIESGHSTARGDYDLYTPERNGHERIATIESKEADYLNASGAPFQKHKYAARLTLPEALGNLTELRFRSSSEVILDIFDLVLCYEDSPPSS